MSISANHKQVLEFLKLGQIKDATFKSPKVWSITLTGKDKSAKYIWWEIHVGVLNDKTKKLVKLDSGKIVNRTELPAHYAGIYWTHSAQLGGKVAISEKTIITDGKNVGKSNATTALTQAMLNAYSLYKFKLRKGGVVDKKNLLLPDEEITIERLMSMSNRGKYRWRVFPMALHDVQKSNNWRHITYPGYIQPKYDGTRFIVMHHPAIPKIHIHTTMNDTTTISESIDGYSRGKEYYEGQDHIFSELLPTLKTHFPGLYLDGELWKEGFSLQDVSGSSRRLDKSKITTDVVQLDYYIFDCFYIDRPNMTFSGRKKILDSLKLELGNPKYIKIAPTFVYKDKNEALNFYKNFLNEKLEGAVLRNVDSLYKFGINKEQRSYTTLKLKPIDDDEWPVIGFTDGIKGKDVGALKWILSATEDTVKTHTEKYNLTNIELPKTIDDRKFDAVSKGDFGSYDIRAKLFTFLTANPAYFENNLKNKLMKIQYTTISNYGKPQQPKVLGFRDEKINQKLMKDLLAYSE